MELQQPLGYRFYPTEEELVSFYLYNKLEGRNEEDMQHVIPVIDIYDKDPWDLPQLAGDRCRADTEQWFFFVPRQEREASGGRISRSTASGCWKATGSPGYVYSSDRRAIGLKRSMVFYRGTAHAGGRKTKWKMHEYKAMEELPSQHSNPQAAPRLRHEFTLCRVYVISGSFRAFDRRPMERVPVETWLAEAINAPGGGDDEPAADNPESSRPEDVPSSFEESVWDWDQLDWL